MIFVLSLAVMSEKTSSNQSIHSCRVLIYRSKKVTISDEIIASAIFLRDRIVVKKT